MSDPSSTARVSRVSISRFTTVDAASRTLAPEFGFLASLSSASLGSTPPFRIASTPMRTSAIPRSSGSAGRSASGLEASETFSLDVMSFVSAFILAALAAVFSALVRPVTASSSRPRVF